MNYFTKELLQKTAIAVTTAAAGTIASHMTKKYLVKNHPIESKKEK